MANTIKIGNTEVSAVMIGNSAVSAVYIGSSKIYPSGGTVDYSKQYLTFEVVDGGNVTITASNADAAKTIQYSTDNGSTWTSLTTSTTAQELGGTLNVGDKVLVKGTNTVYGGTNYNSFGGTAKVNVYGNIMSLISGDSFANNKTFIDAFTFIRLFNSYTNLLSAENLILPATTLEVNCYSNMFDGCTGLTTAPELPATTLVKSCYDSMFKGCTNLKTAPVLHATTLADWCYQNMFYGCTSLVNAPVLPATTLTQSCYQNMFEDCTSLETAPVLPATTLTQNCYLAMFKGCTGLTTAPELPATTLATNCYREMFSGCKSLTTAPSVLPATKLANYCYQNMFSGCTGLTTAPELPATKLAGSCYRQMFYGCTKLNYIKCLATDISAPRCTSSWITNVASSGTFVKAASMTSWTTGSSGIPTGWTVVNE